MWKQSLGEASTHLHPPAAPARPAGVRRWRGESAACKSAAFCGRWHRTAFDVGPSSCLGKPGPVLHGAPGGGGGAAARRTHTHRTAVLKKRHPAHVPPQRLRPQADIVAHAASARRRRRHAMLAAGSSVSLGRRQQAHQARLQGAHQRLSLRKRLRARAGARARGRVCACVRVAEGRVGGGAVRTMAGVRNTRIQVSRAGCPPHLLQLPTPPRFTSCRR